MVLDVGPVSQHSSQEEASPCIKDGGHLSARMAASVEPLAMTTANLETDVVVHLQSE